MTALDTDRAADPSRPLRLVVYDRTCTGALPPLGLTWAWRAGGALYAARGLVDARAGVSSWAEAFAWLLSHPPDRPIADVQYWGHGKWGSARAGHDVLDERALHRSSAHAASLKELGRRMRPAPAPRFWLRTCETVGARRGQDFAQRLAESLGVRVAGHTHVIGWWQSGLHGVAPGEAPTWDPAEGLVAGSPADPRRAAWSTPWAPNTIDCLSSDVPPGW